MKLFKHDAHHYAEQIRTGAVTCTELCQRAFENIDALNDQLQAVSIIQRKRAEKMAAQMDAHLLQLSAAEREQLPPFYGVPILMKDCGQTEAGVPRHESSALLDGYVSKIESRFAKGVKDLGFIPLGRTNTPEFSIKSCSDSAYSGAVGHPIDLTRNPGGSSGGAAAALKAGLVPIVTASDGGGSIRIPASYCGLIGLKPSRGLMPEGPETWRSWQGAAVDFLLTKSVRDTYAGLIGLQDPRAAYPFYLPEVQDELTRPKRLRIGYYEKNLVGGEESAAAHAMMKHTISVLEELGHEVVPVELGVDGTKLARYYFTINCIEKSREMSGYARQTGRKVTDYVEPTSCALYHLGRSFSGPDMSEALAYWDDLSIHMEDLYDQSGIDLLLMPSTQTPALPQGTFEESALIQAVMKRLNWIPKKVTAQLVDGIVGEMLATVPFTQLANLTGQPALSLPLYETADGWPLGSQFVALKGQDGLLLQLAYELEETGELKVSVVER